MTAFAETLKPVDTPVVPPTTEPVVSESTGPSPAVASPATDTAEAKPVETGDVGKKNAVDGQTAAIIAERRRRQKAEAELAYYRGLADGRAKEEEPAGPSDEDLENEYLRDPRGVTQKIVQEAIYNDRLARSLVSAKREFKDYDQLIEKYSSLVPDSALFEQIRNHPEPARFVYEYLKHKERIEEVNKDPAEYEKKIREEIEAKVRKEMALREASTQPPTPVNGTSGGATPGVQRQTVEDLFASRRNKRR